MAEQCGNTYLFYGETFTCARPTGHLGDHQDYGDENWVWRKSGASTNRGNTRPCDRCGIHATENGGLCITCDYWADLIEYHKDPESNLIVADGSVYQWRPGSRDAFGGSHIKVTMHDGRMFGPKDSLWHVAFIPDEYADEFPTNAELEWMS